MLIKQPDLGLNCLLPDDGKDLRETVYGSQNIIYENGIVRTPYGFAKLDLTTTPLDSGNPVLGIYQFRELDGFVHLLANTTQKIYVRDYNNSTWNDITQTSLTMASEVKKPISSAIIGHNDTDIYIDDDATKSNSYYHVIVCDGGNSNIQRWAGRYETDFANLLGGGDYHDGTTHRAWQIGSFQNRIILINAKEYSSSLGWIDNNQRVRWPQIGKLQSWTGTGSGFVDLIDTGGTNLWSAPLGGQYIIYQTMGIWSLNYVGGTTVFYPVVQGPDLGLLSHGLFTS